MIKLLFIVHYLLSKMCFIGLTMGSYAFGFEYDLSYRFDTHVLQHHFLVIKITLKTT